MRFSSRFRLGWLLVGAGLGSEMLHQATILLDNDEIKALPTSGVIVLAAPGEDKVIILLSASLIADTSAGDYTNLAGILRLTNDINYISNSVNASDILQSENIYWCALGPFIEAGDAPLLRTVGTLVTGNNSPITLISEGGSGDFEDGNAANTLRVSVIYFILNTLTGEFE